jgi:hypothetical protein
MSLRGGRIPTVLFLLDLTNWCGTIRSLLLTCLGQAESVLYVFRASLPLYFPWWSVEFCPSFSESVAFFYLPFSIFSKSLIIDDLRMEVSVDHAESVGRFSSSVLNHFTLPVHVPGGVLTLHHCYQFHSSDIVCILYHFVSLVIFIVLFFLYG